MHQQTINNKDIVEQQSASRFDDQIKSIADLRLFSKLDDNSHQFCFLHIPKTAGTSFTSILSTLFNEKELNQISWRHTFYKRDIEITSFKAISGHLPYEIKKIMVKKPIFSTFLRDPIERTLSQFEQSHKAPAHWAYQRIKDIDINTYLEDPSLYTEVSNIQSWILGLIINEPVNNIRDLMNPREYSKDILAELDQNKSEHIGVLGLHIGTIQKVKSINTNELFISENRKVNLEEAKRRIDNMPFFGLTEKFAESLQLFSYAFGIPLTHEYPKRRVAEKRLHRDNLSDQILERIVELNQLDIKLYQYAQDVFSQRYNQMLDDINKGYSDTKSDTSIARILENRYWKSYQKLNPGLLKRIHYDFKARFPTSNWYRPLETNVGTWVWSGPDIISTIDLPLDRENPLTIKFQIHKSTPEDITDSLKLTIDEVSIPLSSSQVKGRNIIEFTGIIQPKTIKNLDIKTGLKFYVCRTAHPKSIDKNLPNTPLRGFAINWIEITPIE